METVTKSEFIDWKAHPVTKAVFQIIDQRIQDAREMLGNTAGEDSLTDRLLVGMIRGFNELKGIDYDD